MHGRRVRYVDWTAGTARDDEPQRREDGDGTTESIGVDGSTRVIDSDPAGCRDGTHRTHYFTQPDIAAAALERRSSLHTDSADRTAARVAAHYAADRAERCAAAFGMNLGIAADAVEHDPAGSGIGTHGALKVRRIDCAAGSP